MKLGDELLLRGCLAAGVVALVLGLAACSTAGYYAQAVHGHLALMAAARPVDEVRTDARTPAPLAKRLETAQQMRRFAVSDLGLPDNASYERYADLGRPFPVWSVVAAPEFSLVLKQWCYPVVGCATYRGYFDLAAAEDYARALRAEGYEVSVQGVAAYSTLGWFPDPLLNSFVDRGEGALAGLVFHELAHQVVYVPGDSAFNESFATAVEREGVRRWMDAHGTPEQRAAWTQYQARREQFLGLLRGARSELAALYGSGLSTDEMRVRKAQILADLQRDYAVLRASWGGWAGYDRFFAQSIGNAHLGAVATYNDMVPGFEALLAAEGGDLPRFYAKARELASLPRPQRHAQLAAVAKAHGV
ncbi:MAG TPA: aminopeptidase [Burkholderiaceae bacterium]|nr:aminopeptidase [Burkholderiaceae bacterium]HRZ00974.1 aminopeptidase [Burkholderiaceae bacterium]